MSKYTDILKKSIIQPQEPISSKPERVVVDDEKPIYKPPHKRRNISYASWEYAYFPHLVNMYKIIGCDDEDARSMYNFFQFIYYVSSGKISSHLDKAQEEIYSEYLIKRDEE